MAPKTRTLFGVVSAAVFVEALFYSAIAPLLPDYAAALHLSEAGAGVLVGAYTCGSFLGALPAGLIANRVGMKTALVGGLAIMACFLTVFSLVDRPIWLLDVIRLGQGFGAALAWTGALAWLVAATPKPRRGELIGSALGAAAAGGLAGPAVGAAASSFGVRPVFMATSVVTLALAAVTLRLPAPDRTRPSPARTLLTSVGRPGVGRGLWLMALPSMMVGVVGVLAPLRLSRLGVSAVQIGAVFILASIVESVASIVSGRWADRRGRPAAITAGLFGLIGFCVALPICRTPWLLALVVALAGFSYGALFAPAMALLTDTVERLGIDPAYGFALLMAAWAPGQLLGATGGGALASLTIDAAPYVALATAGLLTLTALRRRAFATTPA